MSLTVLRVPTPTGCWKAARNARRGGASCGEAEAAAEEAEQEFERRLLDAFDVDLHHRGDTWKWSFAIVAFLPALVAFFVTGPVLLAAVV